MANKYWRKYTLNSPSVQFSSVQSLSCVRLFETPWIAACHAFLSITNSWSLLKLMSFELVMTSSHLILCRPLLLLPPIPPSIRVFSNESTLRMRHHRILKKYAFLNFEIQEVRILPSPFLSLPFFTHGIKIRAGDIFGKRRTVAAKAKFT